MPGGQHPEPGSNWAGNLRYAATAIHRPSSVPELQELVASAQRIKALGTRHSFSAVADSPGVLVALDRLPPDVTVDAAAMTATVSAGMTYGVLADRLEAQGFALHNMGSLPHISVAGRPRPAPTGRGTATGSWPPRSRPSNSSPRTGRCAPSTAPARTCRQLPSASARSG